MAPTATDTRTAERKTLDQVRAGQAWKCIQDLKKAVPKEDQKDYAGEARKLPVRIMASGLGQALAFLRAKEKKRSSLRQLHGDLSQWVLDQRLDPQPPAKQLAAGKHAEDLNRSLLHRVIEGDSDFLRRATEETLAFLTWLNRFAEAEGLTD
jgi:CRISPR-associated protein Cmr5